MPVSAAVNVSFLKTFLGGRYLHWSIADGDDEARHLIDAGLISAGWPGHPGNAWFTTPAGDALIETLAATPIQEGDQS